MMLEPAAQPANANAGRVVQFTNITDSDFTHAFGGQPFFIRAHETVMFPYDLAAHLARHLSRRIFLDRDTSPTAFDPNDKTGGGGRALWSTQDEEQMMGRILGESYTEEAVAQKSELELLKEKVEMLNKRFETGTASPLTPSAVPSVEAVPVAPSQDTSLPPTADVKTEAAQSLEYRDKQEVMAELTKRGITFDSRNTKAKLEVLLAQGK